jgi:predicted Zn-dependent protease
VTLLLVLLFVAGAQTPAPANADQFARISEQASEARKQERWNDAERLYRNAVRLHPDWKEGWWYLGTILYDHDRYAEAGTALRRFTVLDPKIAPAWAFLGLCEFETRKYEEALAHLEEAIRLGLDRNTQLGVVARYHLALLRTREGEFEGALEILIRFAEEGNDKPEFVEAAGLAGLRKPLLPPELQSAERELVLRVGRAVMDTGARRAADAQKDFENLVAGYPQMPNLHYLFGSYLLTSDPDAGLAQLKKELEISPGHVPALEQIAFEYLKRGDAAAALPYARNAVAADPRSVVAHIALGRALIESGDVGNGIRELQFSKKLAPENPQIRIALASAYAKAGRRAEAAQERAEFLKLKRLAGNPEEQ